MSIWKPHVTVATIIEQEGRFLLVEEASEGLVVYNQPAGHVEEGETLIAAAIRETLEESGRHFTPDSIIGIYQWRSPLSGLTYLRVAFTGSCSERDPERELDTDVLDTLWLTPRELAEQKEKLRSPMVMRCVEDYIAGKRYPLDLITDISH